MTIELVLASASEARQNLLRAASVPFSIQPSDVDESILKRRAKADGLTPKQTALALALSKAQKISQRKPDALVLGADQILVQDGTLYDKPETIDEARQHLRSFRGRTHELVSAAVLVQGSTDVWQSVDTVVLSVRDFSDDFMEDYIASEGDRLLTSVGAYRLEERGSQLFTSIEGAHATVLGLPLFPLLEELRNRGILQH